MAGRSTRYRGGSAPGGGSGTPPPTTTIIERAVASDAFAVIQARQSDVHAVSDVAKVIEVSPEIAQPVDRVSAVTAVRVINEPVQGVDKNLMTVAWDAPTRAQAPVGGAWGDLHIASGIGNTGTNYGSAGLVEVSGLATNVKVGYVYFDLRRFSGFTSTSGYQHFKVYFSSNSTLDAVVTVTYSVQASPVPFGEDSANNGSTFPSAATALTTFTATGGSSSTGSGQYVELNVPPATLNTWLGNYVTLKFTTAATTTGTIWLASREYGSTTNRMGVRFFLQGS